MKKRGALADESLPLLKAIWTTNPVEFHGRFFNVPKSYIDLKPVQKPANLHGCFFLFQPH